MAISGQLHFTHQFVAMLKDAMAAGSINPEWIQNSVLPQIGRYPCRGRLFLNRTATNSDNQRLKWQLARRFNCNELRELSGDGWMILYLNKYPHVYLLALIPLISDGICNIEEDWINGD
ncbi:hypothetical protein [Budvicia diplopodorum]|uniref:hypothetical protein n=1 Tax=Budvicia diplopodorum TaxID=1119056 RepID=UPI001357F86F|nr:hypothetical protein [Budvicia diplopodorum]